MDIPIELFLGGVGVSIALAIFGFIRNPQIPAMLVFGGMFIMSFAVMTDNLIMGFFENGAEPDTYIYDVTSSTGQVLINTVSSETQAEFASSSSSLLVGKEFDCMRVWLGKAGAPPAFTAINFGVFDNSNNLGTQFGAQTPSQMASTAITPYTHCLTLGQTHVIQNGDRIGVNFNGGDAVNTITMRVDGNNPFDGTTTYRTQYLGAWTSSTGQDIMMQLYLRGSESESGEFNFEFTEMPKVLFALIGVTMMLCGAIMVGRNQ